MTVPIFTLAQAGDTQPQMSASTATPSAPAADASKNTTVIGMPNAPAPANASTTTAQQAVPTTTPTGGAGAAPSPTMFIFIAVAMIAVMFLTSTFSQKKEKKKRDELMNAMRKGDKVLTLGGLIGHVVDIDGTEVILRVEDGRIRFAKTAIQQVLESKSGTASNVEAKDKTGKPELAGSTN